MDKETNKNLNKKTTKDKNKIKVEINETKVIKVKNQSNTKSNESNKSNRSNKFNNNLSIINSSTQDKTEKSKQENNKNKKYKKNIGNKQDKQNKEIKEVIIKQEPEFFKVAKKYKKKYSTETQKTNSRKLLQKYKNIENIVIIGNGGSINPYIALYKSLSSKTKTQKSSKNSKKPLNVYTINTEDPALLKETYSKIKDQKNKSLIIAISNSGNTSTVFLNFLFFKEFKNKIIITSNKNSILSSLAKEYNSEIILINEKATGRYATFTDFILLPLYLSRKNLSEFLEGATSVNTNIKKQAFELANYLYKNENKGYTDLFLPIYSYKLSEFFFFISQLFHECLGKDGKGLTVYGGLGPETQHHTNQRVFGGRKNTQILMIFGKTEQDILLKKTDKLKLSKILTDSLINQKQNQNQNKSSLSKTREIKVNLNNYNDALFFEYIGTKENAIQKKIPTASIELNIDDYVIGQFTMFLYFLTYYSSLLREVNPFDQPNVDDSKKITLQKFFTGYK